MSDDLTITSPSQLYVDTGAMLDLAARMGRSVVEARLAQTALAIADTAVPRTVLMAAGAPYTCYLTEDLIDEAREHLGDFVERTERSAALLGIAALAYMAADRAVHLGSATVAWTLGALTRIALPTFIAGGAWFAGGWIVTGNLSGEDFRERRQAGFDHILGNLAEWMREHPRLTSNPLLAALLRIATRDADEFLGGLAGIPLPASVVVGDDETGWVDARDVSKLLSTTLPWVGLFRETPVTVKRVEHERTAGPAGGPSLADLVKRLPTNDDNGEIRVRVERYHRPGKPDAFIVYIAGTNEWGATGSTDPSDLTSNLDAMGGLSSGAERAVREAMKQAGVTSSSEVVFVGHSQGGLIAHELAASGDFATVGVFEVGSPADQVDVDPDVPDVRLVHEGDPVAALGGDSHTVDVTRDPWDDTAMPDADDIPVVAHDVTTYEETASLAQESTDPRVVRLEQAIASVTGGATSVDVDKYSSARVR